MDAEDLQLAVRLVIAPQAKLMPPPDDQQQPPPPPPPPGDNEEQPDPPENENNNEDDDPPEPDEPSDTPPSVPEEFMLDAEATAIDPELLQFQSAKNRAANGGSRGIVLSETAAVMCGQCFEDRLPYCCGRHTPRSSPYQGSPRARTHRKVIVQDGDLRAKQLQRKAGALVIFLVDASGSMALNRVKRQGGRLLTEAYENHDEVALIPFRGEQAEVLLPPTVQSLLRNDAWKPWPAAATVLGPWPGSSGAVGNNALQTGELSQVVVVAITDGRQCAAGPLLGPTRRR